MTVRVFISIILTEMPISGRPAHGRPAHGRYAALTLSCKLPLNKEQSEVEILQGAFLKTHGGLHFSTSMLTLCQEAVQEEIEVRPTPALLVLAVRQYVDSKGLHYEWRVVHLAKNAVEHGARDHFCI